MYNFKEDGLSFFDSELQFGQWRNPPPRSTNNGLLYSGIFYTILVARGESREEDFKRFEDAVVACEVKIAGIPVPGLYHRHPGHDDLKQEHDDYVGIAAAAYFLQSNIAKSIVRYGRDNDWYFNNLNPFDKSLDKWFGRFGGVVPHFKLCAGERISVLDEVSWAWDILQVYFSKKEDTSGKIMDWLKVQVAQDRGGITMLASWLWKRRMKKQYPRGMADVFAIYFKESGGYDHPFAKATEGVL